MRENPLLVVIVLAMAMSLAIVLTGHSGDGGNLLAVLYAVIGLAGGGHLVSGSSASADSTVATPTVVQHL